MKYAIFSDIQGNYEALRTFFDEVEDKVDRYLCLGDIVQNGTSFLTITKEISPRIKTFLSVS